MHNIIQDVHREQLRKAIRNFRAQGKGILDMTQQNEDKLPHHILTQLLYEFAYIDEKSNETPVDITIQYSHNKEASPIKLYSLRHSRAQLAEDHTIVPLRVSLISMRHLSLDHIVDIAWFLNTEIPQDKNYVEEDDYCYQRTKDLLQLYISKGIRKIELYQTGYPAAIIGFYRALIEYLYQQHQDNRLPALEVVPYYFDKRSKYYWKGDTWK